jgi:hypothetical protein
MRTGPLRDVRRRLIRTNTGPGKVTAYPIDDTTVVDYMVELECGHALHLHIAEYDITGARGRKVKCDKCKLLDATYKKILVDAIDNP